MHLRNDDIRRDINEVTTNQISPSGQMKAGRSVGLCDEVVCTERGCGKHVEDNKSHRSATHYTLG